ncbi:nucleotide exchange factor GrpE [Microbacter margulisiae]|uniref:Protein GrpE n=1 Tax=Microbacter margulisiae TaxID=1350067 RepID=A0A7W5DPV7_9PORP|nr:nucleotide exchange factor GrpE [Microbacter margulisiae]MBB3186884.1 molecular chaperone GrpE [Microbacter margulisiae]
MKQKNEKPLANETTADQNEKPLEPNAEKTIFGTEESGDELLLSEEESIADAKLKEEIESLQKKYDDLNDAHLRLMAEFDNYRKRTLREKADMIKSAGESVIVNVLPLIDDLERGLKTAENASDVQAIKEGMDLIYSKFLSFLKQNGVTPIDTTNCAFDTTYHEAITTIPAPTEAQKGKIIDSVQKGYMMRDKVIRYAKVIVGE